MGRGFTQFTFPESDAEDMYALNSAFLYYRLPNGQLLHVRQTACWCSICNRIDMAELVESLEELEKELERLRKPDEKESRMIAFIGTPIEQRIAETELRINWRRSRTSPAKCLHCGSTNIMPIPDAKEFRTRSRVSVLW